MHALKTQMRDLKKKQASETLLVEGEASIGEGGLQPRRGAKRSKNRPDFA
jgi:hypothetical protein